MTKNTKSRDTPKTPFDQFPPALQAKLAGKAVTAEVKVDQSEAIAEVVDNVVHLPTCARDPDPVDPPASAVVEEPRKPEAQPVRVLRDFVTIVQCHGSKRLAKTWQADGEIRQCDEAAHFNVFERPVGSFGGLVKLLDTLASQPQRSIIRGKWAGAELPAVVTPEKLKTDGALRNKSTFRDVPHHWLLLDIDEFAPKTADPVLEPEKAVEEFITTQLPECFHGFSCRWNLTGSAGKPGSEHMLKARLAFWLITPYGAGALLAWKLANSIPVDKSLFNAIQYHYTSAPIFETGVIDPVPVRSGVIVGFGDEVDLVIPDSLLAQIKVREHTGDGVEEKDPTLKKGVVGAFCRAFNIDQCLETFGDILPFEFESAGDDRRLNFLDGGGAPGGAFITDSRHYLGNTHNSDPFLGWKANAWDLIRHYKFGHLDDDDGFDDDPSRSTSFHRMNEWAKTLPEVQEQLALMDAEKQVETLDADLETATDTGETLLAQLRALTVEDVRTRWLELVIDAGPIAEEHAINYLIGVLQTGRRPIQQALKQARTARAQQTREAERAARLDKRAGTLVRIGYRPEAATSQARDVERLIVQNTAETGKPHKFCYFAGQLSHVREQELPKTQSIDDQDAPPPKVPSFQRMSRTMIQARVEDVCVFTSAPEGGPPAPICVPAPVLEHLMDLESPTAPSVSGLVTHPLVLPSGRILNQDGLDEASRLLLWNAEVSDCRPYTQEEACEAVARIARTLFAGFEFKTESDTLTAVAMFLSGLVRPVLPEAPAFGITAAVQSTGKTAVARAVYVALVGRDMPVMKFPETREEIDKTMFSTLMAGPSMICIDNIPDNRTFRSATIAAILTAPFFEQRILGVTKSAAAPTNVLIAVTGNHLSLGRDEISRFAMIHLESKSARPDKRVFAGPGLVTRTLAARGQSLRDGIGIIAGYLQSNQKLQVACRFSEWDRMVRQPLVWASAGDVAHGFDQNHEDSEDISADRDMLAALYEAYGGEQFWTADILSRTDPFGGDDKKLGSVFDAAAEDRTNKEWRTEKRVGHILRGIISKRLTVNDVEMRLERGRTSARRMYGIKTEFDDL